MIYILRFFYFFRQKQFAKAIASLPPDYAGLKGWRHYAFYRLGMYQTVANSEPVLDSWRSLFAAIVSNAACGELARAAHLAEDKKTLKILNARLLELSTALLPFYPELAERIFPLNGPDILRLAILLRLGKRDEALAFWRDRKIDSSVVPDSILFEANILQDSAHERLEKINEFMRMHQLAEVSLRDPAFSPGATNFQGGSGIKEVNGPLVSVVMTAYQSEDRLKFSIDSLLDQSYRNIEIIVVDDASVDNTASIVQAMVENDDRVRYVRLPVNVGTYVAKTIGAHLANGEFITCQDSDDWAHPEKISIQMAPMLSDRSIVFTVSNLVRIDDNGDFYARAVYPLSRINHSSVLFRKTAVVKNVGLWDFVRTGADSEFLARLKLVLGKKSMKRINLPLSFCAHRDNSLMTAPSTGYSHGGTSRVRLEYWESFSRWHIESCRRKIFPKMNENMYYSRPFDVPNEISVPQDDIKKCLDFLGLK